MKDIIHVKNTAYAKYEELLLRRDNVRKEAFIWERQYVRIFGEKILKLFELKIRCIQKKKAIGYCQAVVNHGEKVDLKKLQKYLDTEMKDYNMQLDAMIKDHESSKKATEISEIEILEIKKIYRRLAKRLHPDINPKTNEDERLRDLWERISIAYKCNNLADIQELEVLASAALERMEKAEIDIPDIDEKITELGEEIDKIISTDPYMFKYVIEDESAVKEKNEDLDEAYRSYEDYEKQLDELIRTLTKQGVIFKWEMN